MVPYIDKAALITAIERKINEIKLDTIEDWRYRLQREHDIEVMKNILSLINTLEVKEVDLEKELIEWHREHFKKDRTFIGMSGFYLTNNSQMDIAKHFYELGLQARKEERGVKYIDADKLISEIKLIQQSLEHRNVQLNQTKKIRTECMKELCECIISFIISLSVDAESNNAQKGE